MVNKSTDATWRQNEPVAPIAEWSHVLVVRPGGLVCVIEHNPLNPLTRLAVSRCEFDQDAVLLGAGTTRKLMTAGGLHEIDSRYFVLLPWEAKPARRIERALTAPTRVCAAAPAAFSTRDAAITLLRASEADDDRAAIDAILAQLLNDLRASRVDICGGADRGAADERRARPADRDFRL